MATFGTFVDDVSLKASELNTLGAVTTFTPTFFQSAAISSAATTNAYYFVFNKMVFCNVRFTASSAGSSGQRIEFGLPVTAASSSVRVIGTGSWNNAAPGIFRRLSVVQYSTTRAGFLTAAANSLTAYFGTSGGPDTAISSNNIFFFSIMYEAA
jgi:hypothetical protein